MKLPENLPMPNHMAKSEILHLLLAEEYGFLPSAPISVTGVEESCDVRFCAGKAVLKKIRLDCNTEYGKFFFPVYFTCPVGSKKSVPCFVHINFRDLLPDKYQPSEEIVDAGYAVLSFCYKDVTSDDGDFTNGLAGLVYPEGRTNKSQCGKIGLWAWAALRVLDYAMTLPELDHSRISVVGHSRLGKTALLAGALDERFFCAFSNESGCSGAALSRDNSRETVKRIYERFPYWFCENYEKYGDHEETLPFDQHFLLAANAPHRVYVASAKEDLWACPQNEYLACVAASEYFKEYGFAGFVHLERLPEVGDFFGEGHIGYHMRAGIHYFSREDWRNYMKYVDLHSGPDGELHKGIGYECVHYGL